MNTISIIGMIAVVLLPFYTILRQKCTIKDLKLELDEQIELKQNYRDTVERLEDILMLKSDNMTVLSDKVTQLEGDIETKNEQLYELITRANRPTEG